MSENSITMQQNNINKKLNQQTKILEKLLEQGEETKKYLLWLRILGILKIVVIVAPIVFGLLYLPPLVRQFLQDYKIIVPGLEQLIR